MKNKKTTEAYLTQKETPVLDAVFMGMVVVGVILIAVWTFFYVGFGFFGLPLAIIGGLGVILLRSAKVTDEDFDADVKRILTNCGIEENDSTLKEYIVGKSEHIKPGKDKRIRTAFYCVTVFSFKKDICTVKKHVIDLFAESVSTHEYSVGVGCKCNLTEKEYQTGIGAISRSFLEVEGEPEINVPVNVNVYDTEAVIKRLTHKR